MAPKEHTNPFESHNYRELDFIIQKNGMRRIVYSCSNCGYRITVYNISTSRQRWLNREI